MWRRIVCKPRLPCNLGNYRARPSIWDLVAANEGAINVHVTTHISLSNLFFQMTPSQIWAPLISHASSRSRDPSTHPSPPFSLPPPSPYREDDGREPWLLAATVNMKDPRPPDSITGPLSGPRHRLPDSSAGIVATNTVSWLARWRRPCPAPPTLGLSLQLSSSTRTPAGAVSSRRGEGRLHLVPVRRSRRVIAMGAQGRRAAQRRRAAVVKWRRAAAGRRRRAAAGRPLTQSIGDLAWTYLVGWEAHRGGFAKVTRAGGR